jgi:hypothetical protein
LSSFTGIPDVPFGDTRLFVPVVESVG